VNVPKTCINGVVNLLQIACSNINIVKHIACIPYIENREENHDILLWIETPKIATIQ
jgi:hypothetical protein